MGNQDYHNQHDVLPVSYVFKWAKKLLNAPLNEEANTIKQLLQNNYYIKAAEFLALLKQYDGVRKQTLPAQKTVNDFISDWAVQASTLNMQYGDEYFKQKSMLILYVIDLCTTTKKDYDVLIQNPLFRNLIRTLYYGASEIVSIITRSSYQDARILSEARILVEYFAKFIINNREKSNYTNFQGFLRLHNEPIDIIHQNERFISLDSHIFVFFDVMLFMQDINISLFQQLHNASFKSLMDNLRKQLLHHHGNFYRSHAQTQLLIDIIASLRQRTGYNAKTVDKDEKYNEFITSYRKFVLSLNQEYVLALLQPVDTTSNITLQAVKNKENTFIKTCNFREYDITLNELIRYLSSYLFPRLYEQQCFILLSNRLTQSEEMRKSMARLDDEIDQALQHFSNLSDTVSSKFWTTFGSTKIFDLDIEKKHCKLRNLQEPISPRSGTPVDVIRFFKVPDSDSENSPTSHLSWSSSSSESSWTDVPKSDTSDTELESPVDENFLLLNQGLKI